MSSRAYTKAKWAAWHEHHEVTRAVFWFGGCSCCWLQDLPLFNDTIYYNIMYGRLGASQEDIFQAAQQAAVHDQILAMPDGYVTSAWGPTLPEFFFQLNFLKC